MRTITKLQISLEFQPLHVVYGFYSYTIQSFFFNFEASIDSMMTRYTCKERLGVNACMQIHVVAIRLDFVLQQSLLHGSRFVVFEI